MKRKKIISKKRALKCDYDGICKNKAFKEVYPMMLKGKYKDRGWSYLCRKHFLQEERKFKNKLPYCSVD